MKELTVELFAVICTTCHSRLKVRDRAIIGEIVACPKCQGMVLVAPPPDWVDQDEGATPLAPAVPPVSSRAAPASAAERSFADAAALLEPRSRAVTKTPAPAVPGAPPTTNATTADAVPTSTGNEPPPSTPDHSKNWLLAGGVATLGAVALIVVLVLVFGRGNQGVLDDAQALAAVPSTESTPESTETPLPTVPAPEAANPPTAAPPSPPASPQEQGNLDPETTTPSPPKTDNQTPPDLQPAPGSASPAEAQPTPGAVDVAQTLRNLGHLLDDKSFDREDPPAAAPAAPPPENAGNPPPAAPTVSEELLVRPEPRKIDIERRMLDPLDGIEMADAALADFLQLFTDMTTIPVTLDTAALPALKLSPETKLSFNVQKATMGSLLAEALRPVGLVPVARDAGIVVLPAASAAEQLTEMKHEVADLAANETEAQVLAALIEAVVEPSSWESAGGMASIKVEGKSLVVKQSVEGCYAIVLLCEKLRLAHRLPTRGSLPAELLTLAPRVTFAQPLLAKPLTLNFVPPTRLHRVADRIMSLAGVRVLINWEALARDGWTPETEVKLGVANQPLATLLDRLTGKMEASYRVVDAKTVQITTFADLEEHPDIEVYPLPGGEAHLPKLAAALGVERLAPGAGVLRYDTASASLVARLPQPLHRKLLTLLEVK